MAKSRESLVETRKELMVSPTGSNPTMRKSHFIKPFKTAIKEQVFELPPNSLSSNFDPQKSSLKVKYNAWRIPQENWKTWVKKMTSLHEYTWRKAGIYDPIINSTFEIKRNNDLILGLAQKWCPETQSFIFPWGEATITLEDVMISWGYSILGSPVFSSVQSEKLKKFEAKLYSARSDLCKTSANKACQYLWMSRFMNSCSEIEHEAFLALWLSRYVFSYSSDVIIPSVLSIAVYLASGTRIALAPAVLASVYRDLSLLKSTFLKVSESNVASRVTLSSQFQLVQIWGWERFIELQPKPNLIRIGEPKLAQWNNVKRKVDNVKLVLDTAGESFCWRPYAKALKNWDFPKFYREKEISVVIDHDSDYELQAFARCLMVSELVGIDCIEQYLPHRVAMQFGLDQDLPLCIARSNENPEIAWSDFNKSINGVKLYFPFRLFEADVTAKYMEWWRQSISVMQNANKEIVQKQKGSMKVIKRQPKKLSMPKILKATKKIDKLKRPVSTFKEFKTVRNTSNKVQKGNGITKLTSNEGGCSNSKGFKTTPKRSREMHNLLEGSKASNSDDDYIMSILELMKSNKRTKKCSIVEQETSSDDSSCQILPSPIVDCSVVRIVEPEPELADGCMIAKVPARNSDEGDNLAILKFMKSDKKHAEIGQGSGKKPFQTQPTLSSAGDSEAVKTAKPVNEVMQAQPRVGGSDTEICGSRIATDHSKKSIAGSFVENEDQNEGVDGTNCSFEIPGLELELRVCKLERIMRRLKAAADAKKFQFHC